jgi:hypothetical protein
MMFDPLYYFEKAAKAVRGGILAASDNLAFLVSDACRTPDSAAGSPPNSVAVVAPSPKQGSDSPPRDSAIPPVPSGGTQLGRRQFSRLGAEQRDRTWQYVNSGSKSDGWQYRWIDGLWHLSDGNGGWLDCGPDDLDAGHFVTVLDPPQK